MLCTHCSSSIPDDSNFCPMCGRPLREKRERSIHKGPIALMAFLVLILAGSIYYTFFREGKFVVIAERISWKEGVDMSAEQYAKTYCRIYPQDQACADFKGLKEAMVERMEGKGPRGLVFNVYTAKWGKISYINATRKPIKVIRIFYWAAPANKWVIYDASDTFRQRAALELMKDFLGFESRLLYAATITDSDLDHNFIIPPGETIVVIFNTPRSNRHLIEYVQDGKVKRIEATIRGF